MSSYYREHVSFPNVTSGPAPPYPPTLHHPFGHDPNVHDNNDLSQAQDDPDAKRCSVKGCATPLPPDSPHKMCEVCRGRHRIYANTKRAKRKSEKALLNSGQPVAWIADHGASPQERERPPQPTAPVAGPSRSYEVPQTNDEGSPSFDFSQPWLDSRLFSQASELAGALTLPHAPHHVSGHELFSQAGYQPPPPHPPQSEGSHPSQYQNHAQTVQNNDPPPPPSAPEIHPVLAEVLKSVPNFSLSTRITSGPTVPVGASAPAVDGQLPPRFCSIKGCKTLIAGNSFFKMCEPCRNRYRNYGTTKRAKWRKEKEYAVIELQKLREEEDKRRAAQGLPPLPPDDDIWHEYVEPTGGQAEGKVEPSTGTDGQLVSRPPRMCTVSHCREILPGEYEFLRCERHRIQNRHHSKLKRVRDKEVKAQVYDGWATAAAAGGRDPSADDTQDGVGSMSPCPQEAHLSLDLEDIERRMRDTTPGPDYALPQVVTEPQISHTPPMRHFDPNGDADAGGEPLNETPLGEPSHGVPPAARGMRRTNHVCSIRPCANLLSPSNPWKMCDLCRSRDRAGRRLKALRDSGVVPPEIVDSKLERMKMEVEGKGMRGASASAGREQGERRSKKKKKKKNDADRDVDLARLQDNADVVAEASGSGELGAGSSMSVLSLSGDMSNGAVAPLALQRALPPLQDGNSSTSGFGSFSVSGQSSIVFMDPLSPEQAARLDLGQEKTLDAAVGGGTADETARASSSLHNLEASEKDGQSGTVTETTPPPRALKKRRHGKSMAKDSSLPHVDETTSTPQNDSQDQADPAPMADAPPASADPQGVPPPPPNYPAYPYFTPLPPYPPPPNYGYLYSSPKGAYPSPPVYQPACGPYLYPYPGHPYGYPAPAYPPPPGHTYPPAPPPGQGYPPVHPASPSGQPYPPYPHAHAYPPPPSYQSSSPPPQHAPAEHSTQPGQNAHPTRSKQPPEAQPTTDNPSTLPHDANDPQAVPGPAPSPPLERAHEPRGRFSTFIVRTEETYQNGVYGNPCTNGSKPWLSTKRKRDDDGEPEAGGAYSKFRVDPSVLPVPRTDVPPNEHVHYVPAVGYVPPLVDVSQPSGGASAKVERSGTVSFDPAHKNDAPASSVGACSNKNCRRVLPAGSAGVLCDRCKERLKKRQARAKHRFKLEPKSLLGRAAGGQPTTSGPTAPALPAAAT
ncbi:hypothetical protein BC628DRAFT_192741 [Trametes gibbosa]|nr:hypothetical protein BC628DRAFT_192741 [Trametes gibbosa]